MFRNQTDHFKNKGRKNKTELKKPHLGRHASKPIDIASQCTTITLPEVRDIQNFSGKAITFRIGPSPEEQATCFFFQNYALEEQIESTGNFSYLADVYRKEVVTKSLDDALVSLGMAGLANVWKAPEILTRARMKYTSALHSISERLRNIDEAKADQTLISVILLGLWEVRASIMPFFEIC
jgi:hypothetical protein